MEQYGWCVGALWVVCGSIRERNYRLKKKNYLSGPIQDILGRESEPFRSVRGGHRDFNIRRTSIHSTDKTLFFCWQT